MDIDRLSAIIPDDAIILVGIRQPEDWILSVYKQQLQELNILAPKDFFLRQRDYDRYKSFFPKKRLQALHLDSVDISKIEVGLKR